MNVAKYTITQTNLKCWPFLWVLSRF